MKKLHLICVLMIAAVAATAQSDLVARVHFMGGQRISADAVSKAFTNEFCSAEARALENQTFDKLSIWARSWFNSKNVAGPDNGSAQLRPLLDDLLKSEWIFEIRDTPGGSPEYALAIRLGNDRATLWSRNLSAALQNWTGAAVSQVSAGNWELKWGVSQNMFRFEQRGDFVVIDCGRNQLTLDGTIAGELAKVTASETHWLTVDLDWPRLGQIYPTLARFDFPKIQMQAIGIGGNFWVTGKFILSQPLPLLEKWQMPEDVIRQPFNSFTAMRGFGPWLQKQPWAQLYLPQPIPDQLFIWAVPRHPMLTYAATPVPDAYSALAQLHGNLISHTNWQSDYIFPIQLLMKTNNLMAIFGMPFVAPFVQAVRGPAGNFLFTGLLPNLPASPPLPRALYDQINQPGLVYYHWEDTSNRFEGMLQVTQLGLMVRGDQQLTAQSAAFKWLHRTFQGSGQSATDIKQTGPEELTFERRAPCGLTAFEFFALADWLEGRNFPGFDLSLPVRPVIPAVHPIAPGVRTQTKVFNIPTPTQPKK